MPYKAKNEYDKDDLIHHRKYHSHTATFAQEQKMTNFKKAGLKDGSLGAKMEDLVDKQMKDVFHLEPHEAVKHLDAPSKEVCMKLFDVFDFNGNGMLSLAEIDRVIVQQYPPLDHKPALIRAYYASDKNKTGFISRHEFRTMLSNVVYFNQLWDKFEEIDSNHDRKMSRDEWLSGCSVVGVDASKKEAAEKFDEIDQNNGGTVLFKEFCAFCADRHNMSNNIGLE
mmetsp:Transcript_33855/g.40945  ORF Transcript_33855/g.40945 Transcript_33855/m.40945 type:complete len:225 (-) Transcript_33855:417-1091(-)|eukprot:CAMPEP_0197847590 /NCGR_PEP_ID=MMETSP1438-20131217/6522_1 /TAXON_ID=1461541 /ORGANISM="Pterosperma sp., Strain CCMP1384" /LENGTH=224 /DNA_ID=CAMNT_0043459557 /DNA_START=96 /DNA_END=770 /DNA_ORIENTATION=-